MINLADYPTKHHPTKHHIALRPTYILNNLHQMTGKRLTQNSVQLHQQRTFLHKSSTQSPIQNTPQRKTFHPASRTLIVRPLHKHHNTKALSCKGVLKPIYPNPRRLGINMALGSQLSTRAQGWHNDSDDSPPLHSLSQPERGQSRPASITKSKSYQPYISIKADSHSSIHPF